MSKIINIGAINKYNRYSEKIIKDYIEGNDLDIDIDELESDPDFMIQVLDKTKDKNMLELCEDLMTDVYFIEKLINIFNEDFDFCKEKVMNFESNSESIDDKFELNIYAYNLFKESHLRGSDDFLYNMNTLYLRKMVEYGLIISIEEDQELINNWDEGFWLALTEYNNRPLILQFIAQKMTDNHLLKKDFLENKMHKRFKTKEEAEKYSSIQFVVECLKGYDDCLSGYVEKNNFLLTNVLKEVKKCIEKWDEYDYKIENKIDDIIELFIQHDEVINKNYIDHSILKYYITKELNIKLQCFDKINDQDTSMIKNELKEYKQNIEVCHSLNNLKNYTRYILNGNRIGQEYELFSNGKFIAAKKFIKNKKN